MSMNQLPREMLRKILLHLKPLDRLSSSSTCRSWAEEVSSVQSLQDVWFILCGGQMEASMSAMIESPRQYSNLRICGVELGQNSELWSKVGPNLRRLELIDCDMAPGVFYFIVRHCPQLQSVELRGHDFMKKFPYALQPVTSVRPLQEPELSHNVRHFATNYAVTDEAFKYLLRMMPCLESLSLQPHFGSDPEKLLPCILETQHMFTKLDLTFAVFNDEDLIRMLHKYSGSLQELRLYCELLTHQSYSAISGCFKLEHLYFEGADELDGEDLDRIVRSAPDLETLDFKGCHAITDAGLTHMHELRRLQHLGFVFCDRITGGALGGLGTIVTLRYLNLSFTDFNMAHIKSLAHLDNLTTLILSCTMDSESFDVICGNFEKLEVLQLGKCRALTDADGVKLARLKCLRSLKFYDGVGFTDLTFEQGLQSLAMESLVVSGSRLTNHGLEMMAAKHFRLRNLTFENCLDFTKTGLMAFLRSEPKLESLKLLGCRSVRDECLKQLEDTCPRLRKLELIQCPVSDRAIRRFRRQRPTVNVNEGSYRMIFLL